MEKLDNQDKSENNGESGSILKEKAEKGFEFGSAGDSNQKSTVHRKQPKSNHTGIDRGRWAD